MAHAMVQALTGIRAPGATLRCVHACYHAQLMPARATTLYRVAAILLLLLAAGELLACHVLSAARCEISGSASGCDPDDGNSGDECLCCCRHIVVVPPLVLMPGLRFEFFPPPAEAGRTSAVSLPLDHPPRG